MASRREKGRNAQLDRVLKIIHDLTRLEGIDVYELAQRYGAAVKTIRRDLEAIQVAGLPLDEEEGSEGKRKRWKLASQRGGLAKAVDGLDATHYLALKMLMADAGAVTRETGLYAALEDLLGKIEKAVGEKGRPRLEAVERAFLPWDKQVYVGAAKEQVWPLVDAIEGGRICRVAYRAASTGGTTRTHEVLPLKLFVHDRGAYLLCQFLENGSIGTLNLHRLDKVELTDRTAKPPAGFDATRYAESAFGINPGAKPVTYVLRFAPEVATYIKERVWHPSQTLKDLPDGGVELRFRCGDSYEVTSWVAGWREWVEVVKPMALERAMRNLGLWYTRRHRRAGHTRRPIK
jgi:predicted DNA-binding transcriptional regulator YafY